MGATKYVIMVPPEQLRVASPEMSLGRAVEALRTRRPVLRLQECAGLQDHECGSSVEA